MKKIYVTKEIIIEKSCPHTFGLKDCEDEECRLIGGKLTCEECWSQEYEEEE